MSNCQQSRSYGEDEVGFLHKDYADQHLSMPDIQKGSLRRITDSKLAAFDVGSQKKSRFQKAREEGERKKQREVEGVIRRTRFDIEFRAMKMNYDGLVIYAKIRLPLKYLW